MAHCKRGSEKYRSGWETPFNHDLFDVISRPSFFRGVPEVGASGVLQRDSVSEHIGKQVLNYVVQVDPSREQPLTGLPGRVNGESSRVAVLEPLRTDCLECGRAWIPYPRGILNPCLPRDVEVAEP